MRAHDPESMKVTESILSDTGSIEFCGDPYETIEGAEALVIVTEWKAFRSPDFIRVKELLNEPLIFDGRNLYEPVAVAAAGIEYHSIGRSPLKATI